LADVGGQEWRYCVNSRPSTQFSSLSTHSSHGAL